MLERRLLALDPFVVRKCCGGWGAGGFLKLECSHDASAVGDFGCRPYAVTTFLRCKLRGGGDGESQVSWNFAIKIELKSLIPAQIECWRHALHMQVERQRGGNPGGERRTGE